MSEIVVRESFPDFDPPPLRAIPFPSNGTVDAGTLAALCAQLDRIETKLDRLIMANELARATQTRTAFKIEEVAEQLGKTPFTVREWCRHGRINASKLTQKRGRVHIWTIAAGEVERIRNEGLLPADMGRNSV